ncbi:hypothetical protein [Candidatus Solirubrobacter pratensis]|uniref:hypothetical protein n=1 Tax=Candidatus Solirubrobacter pratensis TaxID=1298857 RepID=UPI00040E71B3|nr:hypothetical protein [Candidatus Solirubrobacter pratensis]
MTDLLNRYYSGVVINQNAVYENGSSHIDTTTRKYQTFRLPPDYVRESVVPALTGFQLFVGIAAADARLSWTVEHRPSTSATWIALASGLTTGAPTIGNEVWMTCLADHPIPVDDKLDDEFRISFIIVSGIARFWYTCPNPDNSGVALGADGSTPLVDAGRQYSFMYRILAGVTDSGTDFLGNTYRSVAIVKAAAESDPTSSLDGYWLSSPQPSQFAVVSRYFDMRDSFGRPQVVDRVLLDPITPNVWVHLYYSDDGEPGADDTSWEERIWTPIPKSYKMTTRDTFVLPTPVKAKFIKVEFSHLQAKSYSPGAFQKPLTYKKHPAWVLDYFLVLTEAARPSSSAAFVANQKRVTFNAYDLAFRYYRDDLLQSPDGPGFTSPDDAARVQPFLTSDLTNLVDPQTQALISVAMRPYLSDPAVRNVARNLLGEVALTALSTPGSYPVETLPPTSAVSTAVSSLDREAVIFEQTFPVMYFFVACRHRYREVSAVLDQDRAYFVGINEIAFTRENYSVESDTAMYMEHMGDFVNAERNDFIVGDPPVVNV